MTTGSISLVRITHGPIACRNKLEWRHQLLWISQTKSLHLPPENRNFGRGHGVGGITPLRRGKSESLSALTVGGRSRLANKKRTGPPLPPQGEILRNPVLASGPRPGPPERGRGGRLGALLWWGRDLPWGQRASFCDVGRPRNPAYL